MPYVYKNVKTIDNWMFHNDYFDDETNFLPASIQALLSARLTQCKCNPLTQEQLTELNPVIKAKLDAICIAYRKKQDRSRANSKISFAKRKLANAPKDVDHSEFRDFMSDFRRTNNIASCK